MSQQMLPQVKPDSPSNLNGHSHQPQPKSNLKSLDNGVAVGQVVCAFHRNQCVYGTVDSLNYWAIDFRPNVTIKTLGDDSYTLKCYGAFVKTLDRDFYNQRKDFLKHELNALESAWQFREQLLQHPPNPTGDLATHLDHDRCNHTKRDYTRQLDNGVTIGRIACCRRKNGQILYGEVKSFRGRLDRFRPNVVLEDLSSGYQFSRFGGLLQPLDSVFYQQRKRLLKSEMQALHHAWQARNRLHGLSDRKPKTPTQLLAIALQVYMDESRDINSHYTCISLEFPELRVFGCNALDALHKWVEAYAVQPPQLKPFCKFYKNSPATSFSEASDYVCLDVNTPSLWCSDCDPFCAIGKWISLYSKHSGIALVQSFQTQNSSTTTQAEKL